MAESQPDAAAEGLTSKLVNAALDPVLGLRPLRSGSPRCRNLVGR